MANYQKNFAKREPVLFCHNIVIDNDQKIESPTDICNAFNSFIANVGKTLASGINLTGKIKNRKDYLGPRQQSSIFLNLTDEFEVLEEIQNLSSRKFLGYINIPVNVFKNSKFIIASYIVISLNNMLRKGEYPDILKTAKVIPLRIVSQFLF